MTEKNPIVAHAMADDVEIAASREKTLPPDSHAAGSDKYILGVAYMLSMGVCGTVLVALGSTLGTLAENCNTTATQIGTVFIARGIGAVFGAIFSAKLYLWFQGNNVMAAALLLITILLIALPFNKSVFMLHVFFLFLGIGTAVTDTGCQIMTRKIHGKLAGPWLGANTVAFGISGALVPLIEIFTENIFWQYYTITFVVAGITGLVYFGPNPEKNGRLMGGPPKGRLGPEGKPEAPHFYVEIVISLMVFFFIGGKVTTTAYLSTYVSETNILTADQGSTLILVLWIAITIGRLAGVQDQRFLTNKTLPIHLTIFCVGGVLAMLLVIWFPESANALWVGVAFYGLFNGPCVGYCYDLNNRITYPTEKSMSIVMFGLNFGASLVPYITTLVWNHGGGPPTLIYVTFLSMLLPVPLLHITKYLSYDPAVNPHIRNSYMTVPTEDAPI